MAIGKGVVESEHKLTKDEKLLLEIEEAFGLTKDDFVDGRVIYTKWGTEENHINIEDLGTRSLKISKNLGDVYLDKVRTDDYVIVGEGTTLHCDDLEAGKGVVDNFKGFLL